MNRCTILIKIHLIPTEILCQAEWLSVDPYMRMRAATINLGEPMVGMQVARSVFHFVWNISSQATLILNCTFMGILIQLLPNLRRVIKSKCPTYPENTQVVANFGWVDRAIFKPLQEHGVETIHRMPDMKGLSDSYALGAVGRPG